MGGAARRIPRSRGGGGRSQLRPDVWGARAPGQDGWARYGGVDRSVSDRDLPLRTSRVGDASGGAAAPPAAAAPDPNAEREHQPAARSPAARGLSRGARNGGGDRPPR